ncbi:MAG: class I SAM-dependent methyltransferase [Candidatus Cloacimonetes bacterium]|nr:class I SAM-dependent methyltransferase [Candidatus Cloacimonadota bacterium]
MNITDIISNSGKPDIYKKGSSFMWTDEHISKQLLNIHLNPDIDLASRKLSTIIKTANWILSTQKEKGKLNILDLGCGPGLYSEIFAKKGHNVTGIDISKTSIEYAKKSAFDKKLSITYHNANYLNIDLEADKYDLIVLIYTDLGVLIPKERDILLDLIYRVLKKGGTFVFDVLKDNELEKRISPKSWEAVSSGFWKASPYIALSESFLYEPQKVILFQHIIVDSDENIETYRFWTHFFSQNDVRKILEVHKFTDIKFREDVLPKGDMWSGDNVIFSLCSKN